jgi:hydroxyacylglutathione hydrolase
VLAQDNGVHHDHGDHISYVLRMRVVTVPCLKDNFAYLVIDGDRAAVVDPGEAGPVEAALARERLTLAAIWLTHHHHDHVGGVAALAAPRAGIEVVAHGHDRTRAPNVTRTVDEGDEVALGELRARIIHNPGHTLGAISYVVAGCVFTGDTLFGAGCGRLFEGTPEQMFTSLRKLAALPAETRVYFGHEYTASNLRFAAAAEPDNAAIAPRAAALATPSTPSTIADELATNPFVRARDAAQLAARRAWKDRF